MNCPLCQGVVEEKKGSPVSPYINTYRCTDCGWTGLRCGSSSCDNYLKAEEMGFPSTVRYNCSVCGWSGTGIRVA